MITVQRVAKAAGKHLTRTALKLRQALGARASRGLVRAGPWEEHDGAARAPLQLAARRRAQGRWR